MGWDGVWRVWEGGVSSARRGFFFGLVRPCAHQPSCTHTCACTCIKPPLRASEPNTPIESPGPFPSRSLGTGATRNAARRRRRSSPPVDSARSGAPEDFATHALLLLFVYICAATMTRATTHHHRACTVLSTHTHGRIVILSLCRGPPFLQRVSEPASDEAISHGYAKRGHLWLSWHGPREAANSAPSQYVSAL